MDSSVLLLLILAFLGSVRSVNIVRLTVPEVIKANSTAVILDCDYEVDEWERTGLVLKWYIDNVHLVYQWIPPLSPQATGILSGRVNTSFRISSEPWEAHRAIYIPNPDHVLSGHYSCTVSTFEDEDTRSASMLVWTPAQRFDLEYWRPSEHLVNITCSASDVFPKPAFNLYTVLPDGNRTEVSVRGGGSDHRSDGLYWAGSWGLIVWAETPPDTVIGCTLILPGTTHTLTRNQVYHPDLPIITTTTTTTTTTEPTTTKASERPRTSSNMSQNVPNATNHFFDFSGLFGTASGGNALFLPSLCNYSLMLCLCVLSIVMAAPL